MSVHINEFGNRYGMLTVVKRAPKHPNQEYNWYARCDCGTLKKYPGSVLRAGRTLDCGCCAPEKKPHSTAGDDMEKIEPCPLCSVPVVRAKLAYSGEWRLFEPAKKGNIHLTLNRAYVVGNGTGEYRSHLGRCEGEQKPVDKTEPKRGEYTK